ncbi:MAG: glutathione S-transferase N-terminal domain-containing protein [Rhodospirillaceae bacterium]|nr:glutathione S-transferase N-terminal domain-containing protein [Rhodospirillaceae bacterium]
MKLVFTPNPKYIHKALVVAHEAGVLDRLTFERSVPFDTDTTIWGYNPLGKVPCLILDDGAPLFGGLVICDYLNSLSVTGVSVFPVGSGRWPALRQAMLGEGMFDATTNMRVEGWRPPGERHADYMLRERRKVINALDRMEREAPEFADAEFHIGHICMAGGISYLELRNPIQEHDMEPGDKAFDWRSGRPALAAWYDAVCRRPSLQYRYEWPGAKA